jgi:ABC-type transport system involved in cytochrome bd biosynthesis fused ATPase/permease subunit
VALKISKIAWLTVFVLITTALIITYNTNRDNHIVLGYLLIVLTFPAGLALLACGGFLLDVFSIAAIPGGRLLNYGLGCAIC